jgi:F-type H+-transporting ATPase subunit delta
MRKIAKRYARAYFELCPPTELDSAFSQMKSYLRTLQTHEELRASLVNPAYPMDQRIAAARALAERIAPQNLRFHQLISLLVTNKRLVALSDIVEIFESMIAELRQALSLKITTARKIPSEEQQKVEVSLRQKYGTLASLQWTVDSELLGGIVVQSGDKLFDSSVRGKLSQLRDALMSR